MLLGLCYFYKSVMFYFLLFHKKQRIIDEIKPSWRKYCIINVLFLLKIGSVMPVDQQINLVSPNSHSKSLFTYNDYS